MQRLNRIVWFMLGWIVYSLALFSHYLLMVPGRTTLIAIALLAGPILIFGIFCLVKNLRSLGYKNKRFILTVFAGTLLAAASFSFSLPYSYGGSTYWAFGLPFAFGVAGGQNSPSFGFHPLSLYANVLFYFSVPHILLHHRARQPRAA